jgi:hypothetical protein
VIYEMAVQFNWLATLNPTFPGFLKGKDNPAIAVYETVRLTVGLEIRWRTTGKEDRKAKGTRR